MTQRRWSILAILLLAPWAIACTAEPPAAGPPPIEPTQLVDPKAGTADDAGKTVTIDFAGRPFPLYVPGGYRPEVAAPLVVLLHGYRASGPVQEQYLGFTAEAARRGFLYAYPDGTKDARGNRFWNATDACCNFYDSTVDDSAYLSGLVQEVARRYAVDPARVYLVGHSNGGFMAYRMACDHADQFTAVVSLAGAMWEDASQCTPSRPVRVLQIHGTDDATIRYEGGSNVGRAYPSAATTVADWRRINGCGASGDTSEGRLDLIGDLAGAETRIARYADGCTARVELWTIQDGRHVPAVSARFATSVVNFLYQD